MGKILQGRYDRLLRRTTAQVGYGSKLGEALEDLFPVLDVESGPMELLRASGWHFGIAGIDVTAALGATNIHGLFNPAGSGQILVVTSVTATALATLNVVWGLSATALTGVINTSVERDTRLGTTLETVGVIARQDNGGTPVSGAARVLGNTPLYLSDPNGLAVLAPGTGFRVGTPDTNVRLLTSWFWRERVAEPEELNF